MFAVRLIPFQFHKGTIRTFLLFVFSLFLMLFQFHKGTIRTQQQKIGERQQMNFNSIKVRLEPRKI